MRDVVYRSLGKTSKRLRIGPGRGLDNGVVSLGGGRVMVLTVDPVSAVPSLGMRLSARLSVHLIASDYTTSGNDPEFATFSYNFPGEMNEADRETYVRAMGDECKNLGVAIAGGHTGSYPGSGFTVVGAGSMLGFSLDGLYVTPKMARAGDAIVMTKSAAIEATAYLALSFPRYTSRLTGRARAAGARNLIGLCSTVEDARIARRVGLGKDGVTSMHDATEGGVLGALHEMAGASGKSFSVSTDNIEVSSEAESVCSAFGIDPLATLGEGALLITCAQERVPELLRRMRRSGISAALIGTVEKGAGLRTLGKDGSEATLSPRGDGYWAAYESAVTKKLS